MRSGSDAKPTHGDCAAPVDDARRTPASAGYEPPTLGAAVPLSDVTLFSGSIVDGGFADDFGDG